MNNLPSAKFLCSICKGPVGQGEPVVCYSGGAVAHRFKSTCDWHLEEIAKDDEKFLAEMKITNG